MFQPDVELQEVCDALKLSEKAQLHYFEINQNTTTLMETKYITDFVVDEIINGLYDPHEEYDEGDLGIYVPLLTVNDFYDKYRAGNPGGIQKTLNTISCINKIYVEEFPMLLSVFCLLHELGHWRDFCSKGLNSKELFISFKESYEETCNIKNVISKMSPDDPRLYALSNEYYEKYANIIYEKTANDFALEHIEEAMNYIRENFDIVKDLL